MTPGEFAEIEARASGLLPTDLLWLHRYQGGIVHQKCQCGWEGPDHSEHLLSRLAHHGHLADDRLLAAVRERDNTIARVRAELARHEEYLPAAVDYDCCGYCNYTTGSYIAWPCPTYVHLRAALDPQETS